MSKGSRERFCDKCEKVTAWSKGSDANHGGEKPYCYRCKQLEQANMTDKPTPRSDAAFFTRANEQIASLTAERDSLRGQVGQLREALLAEKRGRLREGYKKDSVMMLGIDKALATTDASEFIEGVRREERERCAKVCDEYVEQHETSAADITSAARRSQLLADGAEACAIRIRRMAEKGDGG